MGEGPWDYLRVVSDRAHSGGGQETTRGWSLGTLPNLAGDL
jgi:hypothetical protein